MSDGVTIAQLGERSLLAHFRSRIPLGPGVIVGVGDDAAAIETSSLSLVTTDALVEGVHFRREWTPPVLLGRKALSVNLSDIASMAGTPRYALVSLALPPDLPLGFVDGLYDGLLERAAETGVHIVGGNVSATSGPIVIDVTVVGHGDRLMRRAGAVAGDHVVVTGALGASAAGLHFLRQGARLSPEGDLIATGSWTGAAPDALVHCLRAHLDPAPPLAFGRALAEHEIVHAGMDISDGLSGDLLTLCTESGVSAWLEASSVPVDSSATFLEKEGGKDGFSLALHGGEDYQFLLAVPPEAIDALRDVAVVWEVPITIIGQFAEGEPSVSLRFGEALRKLRPKSHDHFKHLGALRGEEALPEP